MKTILTLILLLTAWAAEALSVDGIDQHRKSGALTLGQSTRAEVYKAWALPLQEDADPCLRGPVRGLVRAEFSGPGRAAVLRSLTLSAARADDPECVVRHDIAQLAAGFRSGLRLGMGINDVLLLSGKLVTSSEHGLMFENSGERKVGPKKLWYQWLLYARFKDNRAQQLVVSYGETVVP